jgi:hypothetical protein
MASEDTLHQRRTTSFSDVIHHFLVNRGFARRCGCYSVNDSHIKLALKVCIPDGASIFG